MHARKFTGFWGNWAVPGLLFAAAAFVMSLLAMMLLRAAMRQRAARRRASDATAPASAAGIVHNAG